MADIKQLAGELAAGGTRRTAALFRRAELRPPVVLWQPEPGDLASPVLGDLLRMGRRLVGESGLVPASSLDVASLGPLAEWVLLVDPVGEEGELQVAHEGRQLVRHRSVSGTDTAPVPSSTIVDAFVLALYRAVLIRRQTAYAEHEAAGDPFVSRWSRLVLPLADGEGRAVRLAVGAVPETPVRSLVDTVMDAVLLLDGAGRVQMANGVAADMFGWSEGEMIGREVGDLLEVDHALLRPTGMSELRARRRPGEPFIAEASVGETVYGRGTLRVVILRDVSRRRAADERMRRLAFTDALTGIANRAVFEEQFRDAVTRARREGRRLALVLFDLDRLKAINDRHGHPVGDAALREVAERTRRVVRQSDLVARLGGDEFAVLLDDIADYATVRPLVARLLRALRPPAQLGAVRLSLRASFGIGMFPDDAADADRLIEVTDQALYRAKANGGRRTVAWRDLPTNA